MYVLCVYVCMYKHTYIYTYTFLLFSCISILVTVMCFSDTFITINEEQGLVESSILLTNPSSADTVVTVIVTDGTAIGKINVMCIHMFEHM